MFEFSTKAFKLIPMKLFYLLIPSLVLLSFFTGCISPPAPHSEFAKTINFSSLDTFSYKHTLVTGLDFLESDELLLERLSEKTIVSELQRRNFQYVDTDADFFAVVKWKKAVSSYPGVFSSIDGASDSFDRGNNLSYQFASRMHLTLEIYESRTGNMFWRNDLPNIFDAIQMTEERIEDSLKRAIQNFPERIDKDPNLPNFE